MKFKVLIFLFSLLIGQIQCGLLNSNNVRFTEEDKLRLRSLFDQNQKINSTTLPNIYYSLVGLDILHSK